MQTHLKGFGLENFRVFKDYTWFDFAPITILTGPNSSGKSSLNKALMLMKDNFKAKRHWFLPFSKYSLMDNFLLNYDGSDHNLSSGINAISRGTSNPYISYYFRNYAIPLKSPIVIKFNSLTKPSKSEMQKSPDGESTASFSSNSLEILTDNNQLLVRLATSDVNPYCNLPLLIQIVQDMLSSLDNDLDYQSFDFKEYIDEESDHPFVFIGKIKNTLEIFLNNFKDVDWKINEMSLKNFFDINGPFFSENIFDLDYTKVDSSMFMGAVSNNVGLQFGFLLYRNDFHSFIDRNNYSNPFNLETNTVINNFENVLSILLGTYKEKEEKKSNLKKPVELRLPFLQEIYYLPSIKGFNERAYRSKDDHILNILFKEYIVNYKKDILEGGERKAFYDKWFQKFGLETLLLERDERLDANFYAVKELSTVDIGYGMTQIIAVILRILSVAKQRNDEHYSIMFESTILILEEPEANLHPKYQSMLADMISEAAQTFHIQFIIETHSEYLIRKLQFLTAKKEIKPQDSVIYYFHDPNNVPKGEKQVKKIEILEDGSLSDDFGPGFFDEAANLELELIRLKNAKNRNN